MSATRLTFLYPHLFRSARLGESAAQTTSTRYRKVQSPRRPRCAPVSFSSSAPQRRATFAPRHGKAVEPTPPAEEKAPPASAPESTPPSQAPKETERPATGPEPNATESKATRQGGEALNTEANTSSGAEASTGPSATKEAKAVDVAGLSATQAAKAEAKKSGPMEAMLKIETPEAVAKQHLHLSPPPYVHHFDSYSLVKQLEDGGYTTDQAVTAMKAIRSLLAVNLDVAQDSLVSKSDVENETYLFRAACSELSTEVKNNRRVADEHMRQQRALLQHEADILTQSLNQELLTLTDNTRGMFNDRRMAVREEQKTNDSAIQQISYKISIMLSSDAKSEIESLRWILIRRSVLGIIFMAVLTLGTLRYATYVSHEREKAAEKKAQEDEARRLSHGMRDHTTAPDAAEILAAN